MIKIMSGTYGVTGHSSHSYTWIASLFCIFLAQLLFCSELCQAEEVTYGCPEAQVRNGFIQVVRELGGQISPGEQGIKVKVMDTQFLVTFKKAGANATVVMINPLSIDREKASTVVRMVLNLVSSRLTRTRSSDMTQVFGLSSMLDRYTKATVCIYSTGNGSSFQASGVLISPDGLVLTTAHDLDRAKSIVVQLYDGSVSQAKVLVNNRAFDLSLLSTEVMVRYYVDISHSFDSIGLPPTGTGIWTIGCPLGMSDTSARGTITAPPRLLGKTLLLQSDLPVYPGSSGSPVFDSQGHFLALVKGRIRGLPKISFLIPGFYARTLMLSGRNEKQIKSKIPGKPRSLTPDELLVKALAERDPEKKQDQLLAAIKAAPDFVPALYHLGILYSKDHEKIKMEEGVWKRLIQIDPSWGEAYFRLGNCLMRQGHFRQARQRYTQALNYLDRDPRVYNNLGEVLRRLGQYIPARKAFRMALSINPDYAPAHFNLGILYDQDLKIPEKAIYHYRRYLDLRPNASDAELVKRWMLQLEKSL